MTPGFSEDLFVERLTLFKEGCMEVAWRFDILPTLILSFIVNNWLVIDRSELSDSSLVIEF